MKIDQLRKSLWDTSYVDETGGIQRALVIIEGTKGTYKLLRSGWIGKLTDIKYHKVFNNLKGPPTAAISGIWSLGPSIPSGYFVFREPDPNGFMDGYWGYLKDGRMGPIQGSWDGRLVAHAQQQHIAKGPEILPPPPPLGNPIKEGEGGLVRLDQLPRAERQIGEDGNITLAEFEKGYRLAESVGRIVFREKGLMSYRDDEGRLRSVEVSRGQGVGTCFMVGQGIAMTAKHVIDSANDSTVLEVKFPRLEPAGVRTVQLDGSPILLAPDIALVRLRSDGSPWPKWIDLRSAFEGRRLLFAVGEEVYILHYPGDRGFSYSIKGRPSIVEAYSDVLCYTSDTAGGSSGAPVLNPKWELLAVHWGDGGRDKNYNIGYRIDIIIDILRRQLPNVPGGMDLLEELRLR